MQVSAESRSIVRVFGGTGVAGLEDAGDVGGEELGGKEVCAFSEEEDRECDLLDLDDEMLLSVVCGGVVGASEVECARIQEATIDVQ